MREDPLATAFAAVHREDFLPAEQRGFARENRALPIGYGQTNSQPSTVRDMLALLDVPPSAKVLDVGCGSGWTTALLAVLVGPAGLVHGVELVPELAAWARENVARYPVPWASVVPADPDVLGLPDEAPFDAIVVSAEAQALPGALVAQLGVAGRMVVPVAGRLTEVRRTEAGVDVREHGWYSFVPLIERNPGAPGGASGPGARS